MIHSYYKNKIAAYIDGQLDENVAEKIKQHLASCPECARLHKRILTAKKILEAMPVERRSSEFDAKMQQALYEKRRAAERKHTVKETVENVLAGIGEFVWSKNTLKGALALATASLMIAVALKVAYFKPREFSPVVVASRGLVQIYSSSQNRWLAAVPGTVIRSKDYIKLAKLAQVDIESKKLYKMRIKQDSEVHFIKLAKNYNAHTDILIKSGKIMLKTTPEFKGSSMEVVTPAARAEVLGTTLMLDVNPAENGATWVGVLKGAVTVKGINVPEVKEHLNRVLVEEGKKTLVRPGDVPSIPEIFSDKEWEMMDELYRIGDLPQVALIIGTDSNRVEELLAPCMLYVYDRKPRTLPQEFEEIVLEIKEAVKKQDMELHKKAADRLRTLIKKYPHPKYDVQFLLFLGGYYYFMGNYKDSIDSFNRAIDGFPDSKLVSLAICAKAVVYERGLKRTDKAKQAYQSILDFHSNTPEAEYAKRALEKF